MIVSPGYLAGPGDPEVALAEFLDEYSSWGRYSPGQDTTVAVHEQLTAKIELDHEVADGPRWTIAAYESPVGQLAWCATFSPLTPHEVVTAVARRLSYGLAHPSPRLRDAALWGNLDRNTAVAGEVEAAPIPWNRTDAEWRTSFTSSDGTAGIFLDDEEILANLEEIPTVTVWGGPRSEMHPRWEARFTRRAPTTLITAALCEVTQPMPAMRRASQIPAAHRSEIRTEPRLRPRTLAVRSRSRTLPVTGIGLGDPWSTQPSSPIQVSGRQR